MRSGDGARSTEKIQYNVVLYYAREKQVVGMKYNYKIKYDKSKTQTITNVVT